MSEKAQRLARTVGGHLRRTGVAYAVLLFGVALTLLATRYVSQTVEAQERVEFDERANATRAAVDRRLNAYLDAMRGARGLFSASETVRPEEWAAYTRAIDLESRYEGIQALGYAPSGEGDDRGSESYSMAYVEPFTGVNERMLGTDLYADPRYRLAMDKARETRSPWATGKVYLLSEPPPDSLVDLTLKEGFLVFLPVYAGGPFDDTLDGYVVGIFRADNAMRETFGVGSGSTAVDIEVYDGRPVEKNKLYDNDRVYRAGETRPDPGLLRRTLRAITGLPAGPAGDRFTRMDALYVAEHRLVLYQEALPEFRRADEDATLPLLVLFSGLVVSGLLFGTTYVLVRNRVRAERASRERENANRELEAANRELEAFSYSVSHDLRAPLRSIDGFSQILLEDYGDELDEEAASHLGRVRAASQKMGRLIDDLLSLSRVTRGVLGREKVDLSAIAREVAEALRDSRPERGVEFLVEDGLMVSGDARLIRVALENLLGNAFKFTGKRESGARIEFGVDPELTWRGRVPVYYVRDNGAGFDMAYAGKLFGAFQRLHAQSDFDGTGIGLATVQRIVNRHGGRIWAEGQAGEGATFLFTLRPGLQFDPAALLEEHAKTGKTPKARGEKAGAR